MEGYEQEQRIADGTACLQAALEYLAMGWSVLALCPPDHVGVSRVYKPHIKECHTPGKRPWHTWTEFQTRLPTEDEVCQWWKQLCNSNVGVALGPVSGMIRIDVEGTGGEEKLLAASKGELPDTLEFTSGRIGLGRGLLYAIPDGAKIRTTYEKIKKGEELRFQAKGAQTVLPPSRHPSGQLYVWVPGHSPQELKIAVAPAWLLKELEDKSGGNGSHKSDDVWETMYAGVPEGGRNDSAAALIGRWLEALRDINNAGAVKTVWESSRLWNDRNDPPMDEAELKTVFRSILKKEKQKRDEENFGALDRNIEQQIDEAVKPEEEKKENTLPDWHLVVVESEPAEFRLRSPYWMDSDKLKDGYLILNGRQIRKWDGGSDGIPQAALDQALKVVPPIIKGWAKPDKGQLDKLMANAVRVTAPPESKRPYYILGFFYRYLLTAKPVKLDEDGGEKWPSTGSPTIDKDGATWFKLANLKLDISFHREDFILKDMLKVVSEFGVTQGFVNERRWWKVPKAAFIRMGKVTEESD